MKDIYKDPDHEAWGEIGKAAEAFIDRLTDRDDIAVVITPDVRPKEIQDKAPIPGGVFFPRFARLNVNASRVFDSMTEEQAVTINPNAFPYQQAYPRFIGTLVHESGHAKHSRWVKSKEHTEKAAVAWAVLLEETRQEKKILDRFPQYSEFIKTIMNELIYTPEDAQMDNLIGSFIGLPRSQAARIAVLVCARETIGVVSEEDIADAKANVLSAISASDYRKLEALWTEAQNVDDDTDFDSLYRIGQKIQEIVHEDNEEALEESQNRAPCGAFVSQGSSDSDSGDSEGDSEGNADSDEQELPDSAMGGQSAADESVVDDISEQGVKDIQNDGPSDSDKEESDKKSSSNQKKEDESQPQTQDEQKRQRKAAKAAAQSIKKAAPGLGIGYDYYRPKLRQVEPNAKDVSNMRAVMKAVQDAQFRDVTTTTLQSMLPPGRLQIREAMGREIQVESQQHITATPWKQVRRREVENPPITLAIASDISGSMSVWQRAVSTYTWAFASAIRTLKGQVGAVAWNTEPYEIINPNTFPKKVSVWDAQGGSTGCPKALRALDGLLNLSYSEGVRVAVVITDGELPDHNSIQQEVNKLTRNGVIVLWLLTTSRGYVPRSAVAGRLSKPDDFRKIVTETIIKALAFA